MKKRSGIAAIVLSLSLAGSARAGLDSWLLGAIAVTNVGPYIGAAINTATNMGNLYMNYRNGQKIDAMQKHVQEVGNKVDSVDKNVGELGKKINKTNTMMSAFYQDTKIGFHTVNQNIERNTQIVRRDLNDLRLEHRADMATLQDQNVQLNAKLSLVHEGVIGATDRIDDLEKQFTTGMKALKVQGTETQHQLTELIKKFDDFSTFSSAQMQQLSSIQALLEKLVPGNLPASKKE